MISDHDRKILDARMGPRIGFYGRVPIGVVHESLYLTWCLRNVAIAVLDQE